MSEHWLLTTHSAALFPMGVFIWNWKMRKDSASIFMLIKFLYGVTFSLLYHSHHSLPEDAVFTTDYDYDNWALLDGYASSSLYDINTCPHHGRCCYYLAGRSIVFCILLYAIFF